MLISKSFTFEAAHLLPNVPAGHKCRRLHGHSFKVELSVEGPVGETSGWVMDFADISAVCRRLEQLLDHRYLNEIEGLENPTSEVLARWIWREARTALPMLTSVEVRETCTTRCIYRGDMDLE